MSRRTTIALSTTGLLAAGAALAEQREAVTRSRGA